MSTGKEVALYDLDGTIKDLARQNESEYRARYLGECMGTLRCLGMLDLLGDDDRTGWQVKILEAHLQAIAQCEAAGELVAEEVKRRAAWKLDMVKERLASMPSN